MLARTTDSEAPRPSEPAGTLPNRATNGHGHGEKALSGSVDASVSVPAKEG